MLNKLKSVSAYQFSIQSLLFVTGVVAVCFALIENSPEAFWSTLAICIWCWFLTALARLSHLLTKKASVIFAALVFTTSYFFEGIHEDTRLLVAVTGTIALLNVWSLVGFATDGCKFEEASSDSFLNLNLRRKRVSRTSFFALAAIPIVIIVMLVAELQELTPMLVFSLIVCALIPWLVFWRRNRLADFVYDKSWVDKTSWILGSCAFWISFASLIPISYLLGRDFLKRISMLEVTGIDRVGIGIAFLSIVTLSLFNLVSSVLVTIGLVIQWYRDRWWGWQNYRAAVYALFLIVGWLVFEKTCS